MRLNWYDVPARKVGRLLNRQWRHSKQKRISFISLPEIQTLSYRTGKTIEQLWHRYGNYKRFLPGRLVVQNSVFEKLFQDRMNLKLLQFFFSCKFFDLKPNSRQQYYPKKNSFVATGSSSLTRSKIESSIIEIENQEILWPRGSTTPFENPINQPFERSINYIETSFDH